MIIQSVKDEEVMKKSAIITLIIGILILVYGILTIMSDERYLSDSILYVSYRYEITCIMLYSIAFMICGVLMYILRKKISSQCTIKNRIFCGSDIIYCIYVYLCKNAT